MKIVKHIFDSQRRHFQEGGRLALIAPLFNAMETLFFIPGQVNRHRPGPMSGTVWI
ncbi:MAG: hypothetical protein ACLFS7_01890 [Desulfosudaceae bacterium]